MTSDSLASELFEQGRYKDAAAVLARRGELPTHLRVLRAQILVHLEPPQMAMEAAQQLLRERLTHAERARCWEILGKTNLSNGRLEEGLRAMRKAFSAASQAGDPQVEARLIAAHVHGLLQWVGLEAAALEIPRLRQAAVSTADPRLMIAYHSIVAEIAARKSLAASAVASVGTARGLLERFPHAWHEGRLAIVLQSLAILESDYETALRETQVVLACAERSGSRELLIPALGNLANIQLHSRSLDQARASLDRLLAEMRKGGVTIAEIAVLDIEMQLAMARADLARASAVERQIQELSAQIDIDGSYYQLWHAFSRVKWLYLKGDPSAGLALAMDTVPRAEQLADPLLLERMKLAAAEGLARTRREAEGAGLLAEAANTNRDPSLELVAERLRIAGRLAARDDPPAARSHFDRAMRILEGIGGLTARAEVERDRDELLGPDAAAPDRRPPAASHAERFATLMRLGTHAPLLAAEAFSLLIETDAVVQASIREVGPDGASHALRTWPSPEPEILKPGHASCVRIEVGRRGDRTYEIVAVPKPTASARSTVLAIEQLVQSSHAVARGKESDRDEAALWHEPAPEQQLGLICVSERMRDLITTVRRVAAADVTVLLTGETGAGKELFARALHTASARSDSVFLPVNCTALPHDLLDRQLRMAAGGTLFLDEIGGLSLDTQPKLLRFLESGEILSPGEAPQQVDVRIVAATNADLDRRVTEGRFREDLFYRLNVIRIHVPPLRERREEIPALVEHFLDRYCRELQKPALRVAGDTLEYLVLYQWPGNVRQLANEIRRMVALAEPGAVLMPAHLSGEIAASRRTIAVDRATDTTEVVTRIDQPLAASLEHVERAAIQHALTVCDGRVDDAAKLLGLSRKGLYLKRQRLGLE